MINKILFSLLVLALSFAAGRYTAPKSVTSIEQTKETDKTRTTIVRTKQPDGTVQTVTTTDRTKQVSKDVKTQTPTANSRKTSVSLLGAYDSTKTNRWTYGLSVSKEVMGPVTVGIFGLNSGILGLSIGVNF